MSIEREIPAEVPFAPARQIKPGTNSIEPPASHGETATPDRRTSLRYPTADGHARAWIALTAAPSTPSPAWIVDLSHGGALIAVDRMPAVPSIRVRLDSAGDEPGAWFGGRVVEAKANPYAGPPHLLRVEFSDGCPYEVFKAAVWGR